MAVIHVTEAEAALDLSALIDKVSAGEHVEIDRGTQSFAIVRSLALPPKSRTISEAIRLLDERGSSVLLDDKFGDDMEAAIASHAHEIGRNAWE
jgi:antitoxin (DNA-binding transcriptional repressor) of toxin-antitoxin stability system